MRVVIPVCEGVRALGRDPGMLAEGTGCTLAELTSPGARISWDAFAQVMTNLGRACSDEEIVRMGTALVDSPFLRTLLLPARLLFGVDDLVAWVFGPNGPAPQVVDVYERGHVVKLGPGHVRLESRLRPPYRPSRENFLLLEGALVGLARITGAEATVTQTPRGNGADLEVRVPASATMLSLARRALSRLRSDSPVVRANRELSQRYAELEREVARRLAAEQRYRDLFESAPLPMWVVDIATLRFLEVNQTATKVYGYTAEEFATMTIADIRFPEDLPRLPDDIKHARDGSRILRHRKKDGSLMHIQVSAREVIYEGRPALVAHIFDLTQRLALEEQLRQAQKMEAIGQLAGGVAHDFNNLLMVISSYTELLLMQSRDSEDLRAIRTAAARGADLTQKLLAFARRKVIEPRVLDLGEIVEEMRVLLHPVMHRHELVLDIAPRRGHVRADRGGIEQIVMNLAVNARDAMPDGGTFTVSVRDVEIDAAYARSHVGVAPGPHVVIVATDTGTGMDAATRERVFEPFFTTKEVGKGSGLGLSTVLGIVQQNGGHIHIDSEPGRGTSIAIYFPRAAPAREAARPVTGPSILIVEDDDVLRNAACDVLQEHGFHVLAASDAPTALRICASNAAIDLLVSDIQLHDKSGIELAQELRRRRPALRVLWMSGYIADMFSEISGTAFLEKPFTAELLVERVRSLL